VSDTIPLRPAVEELRDRPGAGLTVRDVARRYRVGEDKVRAWIARGELRAVNTAAMLCGRPRWVVSPDALAEFERRRTGGPPPKLKRARRKTAEIDFYPD
jgi:excisionase family DNA binding protein